MSSSYRGYSPTWPQTSEIDVGYRVDHRCIVCMKIKYTRGDQEIRPGGSDIYILIWEGLLATRVASCD
jgi:hypothetical protein